MRSPKWYRDELILGLDSYLELEPKQIRARNSALFEFSEILNSLPMFESKPDADRFRNPDGVGLKPSNFSIVDPSYRGKGMQAYSKLDEVVFYIQDNTMKYTKLTWGCTENGRS